MGVGVAVAAGWEWDLLSLEVKCRQHTVLHCTLILRALPLLFALGLVRKRLMQYTTTKQISFLFFNYIIFIFLLNFKSSFIKRCIRLF